MYSLCVTVFRICERFQGSSSICAIMWFVCLFISLLFVYFYFKPVGNLCDLSPLYAGLIT